MKKLSMLLFFISAILGFFTVWLTIKGIRYDHYPDKCNFCTRRNYVSGFLILKYFEGINPIGCYTITNSNGKLLRQELVPKDCATDYMIPFDLIGLTAVFAIAGMYFLPEKKKGK